MRSPIDSLKKHYLNSRGKRLGKKYVVFESDDWGSERIGSEDGLSALKEAGIDVYSNPFNYLDSLETADDLTALFETLSKFRDRKGNHPAITANTIVANPDFQKIKESAFHEYHFQLASESYKKKQACENSPALIREGMDAGLYHPQFHGREHLSVRKWMSELKSGNEILLRAFEHGIYGIDLDTELTSRSNFMAAFDSVDAEETMEFKKIISEGTSLFRESFGFSSESFISPCYIWHPDIEPFLKENGILYFQGMPLQYAPNPEGDYRQIFHYQGEKNRLGQRYFVRNCYFEPSVSKGFNWIEEAIRRLRIIFFWGKPAIFGTHRINFMGSLDEENRSRNLETFGELIQTILKTWPDVEFTTTDKLGGIY
jgi:hypothetical protein